MGRGRSHAGDSGVEVVRSGAHIIVGRGVPHSLGRPSAAVRVDRCRVPPTITAGVSADARNPAGVVGCWKVGARAASTRRFFIDS